MHNELDAFDWFLPEEKESSHSINRRNKLEVKNYRFQNKTHRFYANGNGGFVAVKKNTKIMKITHKFYVGSRTIVDGQRQGWAKKTLTEAIKHAQELAEETEQDQIVVQVVRVVRVQKRPTIVEKV